MADDIILTPSEFARAVETLGSFAEATNPDASTGAGYYYRTWDDNVRKQAAAVAQKICELLRNDATVTINRNLATIAIMTRCSGISTPGVDLALGYATTEEYNSIREAATALRLKIESLSVRIESINNRNRQPSDPQVGQLVATIVSQAGL